MSKPGAISNIRMPVVSLTGLRPTSLGNYLATLGLHRVASRQWLRIRLAWRDGIPCLVGGPLSMDELLSELVEYARKRAWTNYELAWQSKQKEGTKAKSGEPVALWRATANESILTKLDAHIVPAARLFFNPLLGSGGNAGKRNFANGWKTAVDELHRITASDASASAQPSKKKKSKPESTIDAKHDVRAWLEGEPVTFLVEKAQAASWFSEGNKLFNSGQSPARDGQISPWAMVLACEGLDLFAGGISRRLGARARSGGAFPFVIGPAAPINAGEAGRDRGEVWAPLWARPATLTEVRAIFARGRAELNSKGAVTPAAFAAAILRRGVDAGLTAFVRFALGATTSSNTFEPRLLGEINVPQRHRLAAEPPSDEAQSNRREVASSVPGAGVLGCALDLCETLPRDTKKGKRWLYKGLRGPIEASMISLAKKSEDASCARALTDAIVVALDRVDRNRSFRKAGVRWRPLPLEWLPVLLGEDASSEARLAAAIVSSFPATLPFTLYRFGVELTSSKAFLVPDHPSPSWVWGGGRLVANMVQVLRRRTLDLSRDGADQAGQVMRKGWPASIAALDAWLAGGIDESLLGAWLGRFALFDWRSPGARPATLMYDAAPTILTGTLALHALLQPLLDRRPVRSRDVDDLLSVESGARTAGVAQKLVTLLCIGRIDDAVELARVRYAIDGTPLARWYVNFAVEDPSRFTASLLVPVSDEQHTRIAVQRWLRPSRKKGELQHVYA